MSTKMPMTIFILTSDGEYGVLNTAYATKELAHRAYIKLIEFSYGKTFETYEEALGFSEAIGDEWAAWVTEVKLEGAS